MSKDTVFVSDKATPTKSLLVRIYYRAKNGEIHGEVINRSSNYFALWDDYLAAIELAKKRTAADGLQRWVDMEQAMMQTHIASDDPDKQVNISWLLKRILMSEIDNEGEEGGQTPITLGHIAQRLTEGVNPDERRFSGENIAEAMVEILELNKLLGSSHQACDVISDADWQKRAEEDEANVAKRHAKLAKKKQS